MAAGVTDLRCGFDGLSALIQTKLEQSSFSGHVFECTVTEQPARVPRQLTRSFAAVWTRRMKDFAARLVLALDTAEVFAEGAGVGLLMMPPGWGSIQYG